MRIIVCIKQVPDTIEVKIDPETHRIVREGVKGVLNPFDAYAVEEAVRLKEQFGGETTAVTMGPQQAEQVLRDAIAVGIDRGVLLTDRKFVGSDTLATSYALSRAVKKLEPFDLVICGFETIDGSTGQVGPELATHLGVPCVPYVSKILSVENGRIECRRLLEDHYETLSCPLPAVLTVTKEINEPRIPSLKGLLKAKKAEITVWSAHDVAAEEHLIGHDGSPTWVVDIWKPVISKEGRVVKGDAEETAEELFRQLKTMGVV